MENNLYGILVASKAGNQDTFIGYRGMVFISTQNSIKNYMHLQLQRFVNNLSLHFARAPGTDIASCSTQAARRLVAG